MKCFVSIASASRFTAEKTQNIATVMSFFPQFILNVGTMPFNFEVKDFNFVWYPAIRVLKKSLFDVKTNKSKKNGFSYLIKTLQTWWQVAKGFGACFF